MSSGFKTEDLTVKDLFMSSDDLRMPPYQRGYSWTDTEAGDLLGDLRDASETGRPYFLGAIVAVQNSSRNPVEVVDGQQRLTTLSILFAVLRDLSESRDDTRALHALLETPGRTFPPEPSRWRLTLNHVDSPFFRETVQKRGATNNADFYESETESRQNILTNMQLFRETLSQLTQAQRSALTRYIMEKCIIVRVKVADRDAGYGAFRVLNMRGRQLNAHDILKSDLFERAGFTDDDAQAHAVAWAEFSGRLRSTGFDDLLKQIRSLFENKASKEDMVTGYRNHVLTQVPARVFLEDRLPRYVDAYEIISGLRPAGNGFPPAVVRYIDHIRSLEHINWRAAALKYLVDGDMSETAATRFFAGLERLAFTMQFVVSDRDARTRRYRRVINAISEGDDFTQPGNPLEITDEEKTKLSDRLIGRFATFRQRRAMSLRLNALVPNGTALSPDADATLEHVLPRNPSAKSKWMEDWPDATVRRELVDCLGNFTLLTNAENQDADRVEFDQKKDVFFKNGSASFRLSDDIANITQWSPDQVRRRRDWLADLLRKEWELG